MTQTISHKTMFDKATLQMLLLTSVMELLLLFTVSLGDKLLLTSHYIQSSNVLRAFVDASTHGTVGLLSWGVVVSQQIYSTRHILEMIIAGFMAGVIDLDHFLAAGSLRLHVSIKPKTYEREHEFALEYDQTHYFIFVKTYQREGQGEREGQLESKLMLIICRASRQFSQRPSPGLGTETTPQVASLVVCIFSLDSVRVFCALIYVYLLIQWYTFDKSNDTTYPSLSSSQYYLSIFP